MKNELTEKFNQAARARDGSFSSLMTPVTALEFAHMVAYGPTTPEEFILLRGIRGWMYRFVNKTGEEAPLCACCPRTVEFSEPSMTWPKVWWIVIPNGEELEAVPADTSVAMCLVLCDQCASLPPDEQGARVGHAMHGNNGKTRTL